MKQNKKTLGALAVFVLVHTLVITVGICVLKVPVVPLCLLMILQSLIVALLHHAELWVHGLVVVAEIVTGAVTGKILLAVMLALIYGAGMGLLIMLDKGEK